MAVTVSPPTVSNQDRERLKRELGPRVYARWLTNLLDGAAVTPGSSSFETDEAVKTAVDSYYVSHPNDPNRP